MGGLKYDVTHISNTEDVFIPNESMHAAEPTLALRQCSSSAVIMLLQLLLLENDQRLHLIKRDEWSGAKTRLPDSH